jgi:hypothetical protein
LLNNKGKKSVAVPSIFLRTSYIHYHFLEKKLSLCYFLTWYTKFHTRAKEYGKLYFVTLTHLGSKNNDRRFWTERWEVLNRLLLKSFLFTDLICRTENNVSQAVRPQERSQGHTMALSSRKRECRILERKTKYYKYIWGFHSVPFEDSSVVEYYTVPICK